MSAEEAKAGEIALSDAEIAALSWIKAKASSHNGACVEIAAARGNIAIRDSKDPAARSSSTPPPNSRRSSTAQGTATSSPLLRLSPLGGVHTCGATVPPDGRGHCQRAGVRQ